MNSGTVHLIATDPPFNKGRDFHATPDSLAAGARFQDRWSWVDDVHDEWVDQITDDWPDVMNVINGSRKSYGDDMGAFLCFMGVRLLEMRRVLRDDGSIYLHCDTTASHYLKELMDAIFGKKNFRNEIVWHYGGRGAKAIAQQFARNRHVLLFYTKSERGHTFHRQYIKREYTYAEARKNGFRRDDQGRWFKTSPRGDYTDKSVARLRSEGRIHTTSTGKIRIKYFLESDADHVFEDALLGDVWSDIPDAMHIPKKERTGYPTQKPLRLYERIILASSDEEDWVLDPFSGCATTCVAAERLKRQWVGIDIWDKAHGTVIERLQKEGLAAPDGDTGGRLLSFGEIGYSTVPPVRTDDGEEPVPFLRVKVQRATESWQRLSRKQIVERLEEAQAQQDMVICGGCGRVLEPEFMHLDHIQPRAEGGPNDITNRILLCPPCNGRKRDNFTLRGLMRENKKQDWMRDESRAKIAQHNARAMAARVRNEMG